MTDGGRPGSFVATEAAAHLSTAPEFQGERVPASAVVTRDAMTVRFTLPNGGEREVGPAAQTADGSYRGTSRLALHDAAGGYHDVEYRWVRDDDAFVLVFETAHAGDVVAGRLDLASR